MAKPDKKKKVKGFKEFDGSKYINTEPVLDEAKAGTVVIAWGRMNPMTAGHEMLVKKVIDVAKTEKGTPQIYLTHSQGAKTKTGKGAVNKDPLAYDDKIKFAQKAFGPIVKKSPAKTIIQLLKLLDKQFDRVVLVAGSDRVTEFNNTLNKYNGKEYKFSELKIVSAGQRDEEADDVSGISGTKMRGYAKTNMKKFTANLPKKLKGDAEKIAALVNKGTQMTEESDLDEALSRQQRRKRGLAMKKARFKIARGREKAKRKTASMEVLKKRARKAAINILKTKFAKSRRYADMSAGEKEIIDKRIEKVSKQRIDAIAKKLLPKVKTAERERRLNLAKGGSSKQEEVTETTGAYFKGVEKEKRDDRERHFDRNAKKADDDASAYKPAPGDKEAKTKESKHTKKARAMGYIEELVWEDLVEGLEEAMWGQRISKKPHMLMDKNNKVKFDKRFKMYKPKVQEDLDLSDIKDLANSTEDFITEEIEMRSFSQFIKEDWVCGQCSCDPCTCGGESLDEDAAGKSLADKAKKANMPTSVLRQVYNRGVAAWKTGHRPGTTPEQWGHARVNSFITKSKGTWGKADKDLADKVRKESLDEEVQLDELTAAEKKLINQMYDKKGNLTPMGKKVMDHGKANSKLTPKNRDAKIDEISMDKAISTYAARKSQAQGAAHQGSRDYAKKQMAKARKTKAYIDKRESIEEAVDLEMHKKAAADHAAKAKPVGNKWPKGAAKHDNAAQAHQHAINMHKKFGPDHSGTKNAVAAAKNASDRAGGDSYKTALKKSGMKEEVKDLDEAPRRKGAPKMTGDSIAIQRAKDAEHNKAMGRTKTGRKKPVRTMTSTQRSLAQLRGEETIEEKNGLWANIHAKRDRGEKMRKKGEEGAPTPEAIKRAQESFSEDLDAIMSNLDMVNEVCGAGEQGTPELTKKYKKDTPMEDKK